MQPCIIWCKLKHTSALPYLRQVHVCLPYSWSRASILFRSGSSVTIWRLLMWCQSLALDLASRGLVVGLLVHLQGVLVPLNKNPSLSWSFWGQIFFFSELELELFSFKFVWGTQSWSFKDTILFGEPELELFGSTLFCQSQSQSF